jgi:hypothetical protein
MKTQNRYLTELLMSLSLAVVACGGGATPPAESPSGTSETSAVAPTPTGEATPAEPAPAPEPKEAPAAAGSDNSQRSGREPREILELKDTVFFFSFEESDAKQAAEASCAKQGKDPKKTAACMSKARQEFDGDGYRFTQDKAGDWWWSVIKRKGNTLTNVHKVRYQYGEQNGNTVVIKPEGKDEGSARWAKVPSEVKFEVPNEYRIVVSDPKHGKMVYEAKAVVGN